MLSEHLCIYFPHSDLWWWEIGLIWSAICCSAKKSNGANLQYDFVKKGYLRVLTMFWKYYTLDKHLSMVSSYLDQFFYNLLYTMDNIILLH